MGLLSLWATVPTTTQILATLQKSLYLRDPKAVEFLSFLCCLKVTAIKVQLISHGVIVKHSVSRNFSSLRAKILLKASNWAPNLAVAENAHFSRNINEIFYIKM